MKLGLNICAVALAGALLYSPLARAADWSSTFPTSELQSWVSTSGVRVLVVGAGEPAGERDSATAALTDALRASSKVKLVLGADGLGDIAALDDATIISKAKVRPVDQIFVVRLFPASDKDYTVVVTMYAVHGTVVGAFTAASNDPVDASGVPASTASGPITTNAGTGLTAAAAATLSGGSTPSAERSAAERAFDERGIFPETYLGVSANTGWLVSSSVAYRMGRYGELATPKELYTALGRPDLARAYTRRHAVNIAVSLGSGALATVGYVELMLGAVNAPALYDDLIPKREISKKQVAAAEAAKKQMVTGAIAAGVGTFGLFFPFVHHTMPVAGQPLRKLVDDYNENVARELGLLPSTGALEPDAEPGVAVAAGPWTDGVHAGLRVELSL